MNRFTTSINIEVHEFNRNIFNQPMVYRYVQFDELSVKVLNYEGLRAKGKHEHDIQFLFAK